MYYFRFSCIIFYFIYLQEVGCFFSYINKGFNYVTCSFRECCDEYYIKKDIRELNERLRKKLFGQHIAHEAVISALSAHINLKEPSKALVMSFHGPGGTGKNYVAKMIVESFYHRNDSSQYVHLFYGRIDFPREDEKGKYQEHLKNVVIESLLNCPESLFVFDEVDMIIPEVLDVLVPFMDYGIPNVWYKGQKVRVVSNKAIFIFLSNTGSHHIITKLMQFWGGPVSRDKTKLADFEDLISVGAFNEKGGFYKSGTIQANLIDHYVPFLPLEKVHVEQCIIEAFQSKRAKKPTQEEINEILEFISYGPEEYRIFAKGGCKRIDSKVVSLLYRFKHKEL